MASERMIRQVVRAQCVDRDGYCRLGKNLLSGLGPCDGHSTWAHLWEWRRFLTRHLSPTERHCTIGSCMLCWRHHQAYDGLLLGAPRLQIHRLTDAGANGPLAFEWKGRRFDEAA